MARNRGFQLLGSVPVRGPDPGVSRRPILGSSPRQSLRMFVRCCSTISKLTASEQPNVAIVAPFDAINSGKPAADNSEPSDMKRVSIATAAAIPIKLSPVGTSTANAPPSMVATPLPPLPPSHGVKQCPATAATNPTIAPPEGLTMSPTITANQPFPVSMANVANQPVTPSALPAFVAPIPPLPNLRRSTPASHLASRYPDGTLPNTKPPTAASANPGSVMSIAPPRSRHKDHRSIRPLDRPPRSPGHPVDARRTGRGRA